MLNSASAQLADSPAPMLGQLKYASERIAIATQNIGAFVDRFHGPQPSPATNAGPGEPAPESYRNDIDTLFVQLDRLETAVSLLPAIG